MLRALGHVGVFAGLYVGAAMVCFWQLAGLIEPGVILPSWDALAAVVLIATGTYALDRVKLRDAWIDPADRESQPDRYAFLCARSGVVRGLAFVAILAGSLLGMRTHVLAPAAGALAVIGVVMYAPAPRTGRRRVKDWFGIKNAYVAAGITGFVALASTAVAVRVGRTGLWEPLSGHLAPVAAACLLVGARTFFDAAICDLDDEAADREHGTTTLPTHFGGSAAWLLTGVARALIPLGTLACPWCPWKARIVWAGAGLLGVLSLRLRRPQFVRDLVDIRFVVEAIAASIALWVWQTHGG